MGSVPINRARALIICTRPRTISQGVCGKQRGICSTGGTRQRRSAAWRSRRSSGGGASEKNFRQIEIRLALVKKPVVCRLPCGIILLLRANSPLGFHAQSR